MLRHKQRRYARFFLRCRDLKRLSCLLAPPKSNSIVEIRDKHGSTLNDKSDISEVFATFYEDLYSSRVAGGMENPGCSLEGASAVETDGVTGAAEPFSMDELRQVIT